MTNILLRLWAGGWVVYFALLTFWPWLTGGSKAQTKVAATATATQPEPGKGLEIIRETLMGLKVLKFEDGGMVCYMLEKPRFSEATGLSCVVKPYFGITSNVGQIEYPQNLQPVTKGK